ncbi:siderophore-interacting protein [Agreia sp. Leaf210]|uniref:siderophore-interacting protein n=1 Tax=Agreia sp. Leaf210 TaxID=1735682 RepID=UPI00138F909D|nr:MULTISPECIES: SIP domain-containing protein [Microbacteriaceae]
MRVLMTEAGAMPTTAGRVLLAGDSTIIPVIQGLIETLPDTARGQIFIEVETALDIIALETPERITVSWLARDVRTGTPGQVLGRAVRAWVSEMTTGDVVADGAELCVWLGGEAARIDDLRADLAERLGSSRETLAR